MNDAHQKEKEAQGDGGKGGRNPSHRAVSESFKGQNKKDLESHFWNIKTNIKQYQEIKQQSRTLLINTKEEEEKGNYQYTKYLFYSTLSYKGGNIQRMPRCSLCKGVTM